MEPPGGGQPPDRERHQQPQLVPLAQPIKSTLTLNLQQQQQFSSIAANSPAAAAVANVVATAGSGAANNNSSSSSHHHVPSTSPALASTATAISATTQAATAFSGSSIAHQHQQHHHQQQQQQQHQQQAYHPPLQQNSSSSTTSSLVGGGVSTSGSIGSGSGSVSQSQQQQTIEKLSRPMAFDKMESLVREMQDPEHGVPVRQQKMFLTSIPYAFMGYDLIEWLMDRLLIEESEALNIANQLCLHGYFFPVNDTKTLTVKDDSSLYRFQTPYYWPWQHKAPDNVEYAIYLAKRSLRNKQRHALEDYEAEALASLHKNLKGKWDFISMQAEEQVRLAKERKKGDKIVGDSQERAYWRVHRPPPGQFTPLEPCPIPSRDRQGTKQNKKKTLDDVQREVDYLKKSLNRTRMKMSQACESLVSYSETFMEYDFFLQPVLPSNPWVTEDITFWQLNNTFVDIPTEKRVRRWAISIEELVCDPTGLQEFTSFLEKEYSHENIRFWIAVNRLRRSAHSQVVRKVNDIYEEFLKPGAPCEINIDGKTMESVLKGLKNPSRFTFDSASEHIYMLLLKKDCYPRFVRSDHFKRLLETGIQPSHKKRFFNFGGVSGAKKKMTAALSSQPNLGDVSASSSKGMSSVMMHAPPPGSLARRRGSDRSLTGSAHELAVIGVNKETTAKVPHSHSQSNLSEIPYSDTIYRGDMPQRHQITMDDGVCAGYGTRDREREYKQLQQQQNKKQQDTPKPKAARLETTIESANSSICPWDVPDEPPATLAPKPATAVLTPAKVKLSVSALEQENSSSITVAAMKTSSQRLTSTSSDITDVSDRLQRSNLGIRHQNTVDSGEASKRLMPNFSEQRRASVSFSPTRLSEHQFTRSSNVNVKKSTTPSPTVSGSSTAATRTFPPLQAQSAIDATSGSLITKDPPSSSDAEIEEELNKLTVIDAGTADNGSGNRKELSSVELPTPPPPPTPTARNNRTPTPTPPPMTKVTPPPPPSTDETTEIIESSQLNEEQLKESPRSESLCIAEASITGSSGESEADADAENMVQIELIETVISLEAEKGEQPAATPAITPTILVNEPTVEESAESCHQDFIIESVATENEMETETECSRIKTPEVEIEVLQQPPPIPAVGPMEEEELLQEELSIMVQEELSPTTDEYQEGLQFGAGTKDGYEYDIVDTDTDATDGYIPPAPTPAPSMAPLAELDLDTVDDEPCEEMQEPAEMKPIVTVSEAHIMNTAEEVKKRRKKRNSDAKKLQSSIEDKEKDKDKDKASTSAASAGEAAAKGSEADRNTVCPWEDENVSASDGTFVKTYATLGYL